LCWKIYVRCLVSCTNYGQNIEELCSNGIWILEYSVSTDNIAGGCENENTSVKLSALSLVNIITTDENLYQEENQSNRKIAKQDTTIIGYAMQTNVTTKCESCGRSL
jgi:hypothetical protein